MKDQSSLQNYGNQIHFENSPLSKSEGGNWAVANQSKIPPKKRFGATIENSMNNPETDKNQWNEKQQMINKTAEMDHNFPREEARTVTILPGVIRHTSCPKMSLAYYYNYSFHLNEERNVTS